MATQGISPAGAGTMLALPGAKPREATVFAARHEPGAGLAYGLALLSAGLLYLSFFPVAWGWLAWVGLVPLLVLVRWPGRGRTRLLAALLGGLAFYWPVLQWLRVADPRMYATWAALATYCAFYVPVTLVVVRWLDRRTPLPLVVSLPVAWTALEYFRSCFIGLFASLWLGSHQHDIPGGFSWYLLGYTQHDVLPLLQVADVGGVYAVSFLVCVGNALVFEALYARPGLRARLVAPGAPAGPSKVVLAAQGLGVLLLFTGVFLYGFWRLGQLATVPGPRLALLQSNMDQRIRNATADEDEEVSKQARLTSTRHCAWLSVLAARQKPDLVVWPETSFPDGWEEGSGGEPLPDSQRAARYLAGWAGTDVLVGVNATAFGPDKRRHRYNSAVLLDRYGRRVARYDKIHRVPFGEYVPLRETLPFLNHLAPYDFDYSVFAGTEHTRLPVVEHSTGRCFTFGVVICYEDTVPEMARPFAGADGNPPADFLLNITNDGWFDGTSEHDEHLAVCRFRAVECRRSVARAVNMGISAVIDSSGRVLRPDRLPTTAGFPEGVHLWEVPASGAGELPVSRWRDYKKVAGVLMASVPIDTRVSPYSRWGNWLPWSCWTVLLLVLLVRVGRRLIPLGGVA
jgi:apolipoprotein N-acyltransferase